MSPILPMQKRYCRRSDRRNMLKETFSRDIPEKIFLKGKNRPLLKHAREWKISAKPNRRVRNEIGRAKGTSAH